jgi:hypothetical protein
MFKEGGRVAVGRIQGKRKRVGSKVNSEKILASIPKDFKRLSKKLMVVTNVRH